MNDRVNDRLDRCIWAALTPAMIGYHDTEWGVPVHDDRLLFEFLTLEGAQAGLSWSIILNKRDAYRRAFDKFDYKRVATYDDETVMRLLTNPGIVRNRLKIGAAVNNARAFLNVANEYGSFDNYIWQFTGGCTIQNAWRYLTDIPAETPESQAMSRDLKRRGFRFVGPTICYAFMQAVGMVNDHTTNCFRYIELGGNN